MNTLLTKEEKDIEKNAHLLKSASIEKKHLVEEIIIKAKKNQTISLRLSEFDLNILKNRAEQAGIPYQTMISMIIHKYVTDQFYDKDEFRKIISNLQYTL